MAEQVKILLVDDEESILTVVGAQIKAWGYDLVAAGSGREALDIIKDSKPDIAILDYLMPEMDGIDTLREIRKIDDKLPVIMFTAYPDQISIKGTETLGVRAYVPKLSLHSNSSDTLRTAIGIIVKG